MPEAPSGLSLKDQNVPNPVNEGPVTADWLNSSSFVTIAQGKNEQVPVQDSFGKSRATIKETTKKIVSKIIPSGLVRRWKSRSDISTPVAINSDAKENLLPNKVRESVNKINSMDDESNNTAKVSLKPLDTVVYTDVNKQHSLQQDLNEDFEYYARTKDLEIGTERTEYIQNEIINKLLNGRDIKTRVVIMHKEEAANAFVYPDGTIFISQSLINKLDSLDKLASVFAHELSHLIHKTSLTKENTNSINRPGVAWAHEAGCDQWGQELLEDAGFRTWAATSIENISLNERGMAHQTGLARSAQITGSHGVIDRSTSGQKEIPLPEFLKADFQSSSLEVAMAYISQRPNFLEKGKVLEGLGVLLPKLHPRDLLTVYSSLIDNKTIDWINKQGGKLDVCNDFIFSKLIQQGYSEDEAKLFVIINISENSPSVLDAYGIHSSQDVLGIVNRVREFESTDRFHKMYRDAFGKDTPDKPYTFIVLDLIQNYLRDETFPERVWATIPVTRETFVEAMEIFSNMQLGPGSMDSSEQSRGTVEGNIAVALAKYIDITFLTTVTDIRSTVDSSQLRDFFEEIKERKILIDPIIFLNQYKKNVQRRSGAHDLISEPNKEEVVKVFKEVYSAEINKEAGIDQFFDNFFSEVDDHKRSKLLQDFLFQTKAYINQEDLSSEQVLSLVQIIGQRIDASTYNSSLDIFAYLKNVRDRYTTLPPEASNEERVFNEQLSKFNLKLITALALFNTDDENFYSHIEKVIKDLPQDRIKDLDRLELASLCQGLIEATADLPYHLMNFNSLDFWNKPEMLGVRYLKIKDLERFSSLSLIRELISKTENTEFQNIKDLVSFTDSVRSVIVDRRLAYGTTGFSIFDDSFVSVIFGRNIRKNFHALLQQGIKESELADYYTFIDKFYPSNPQKGLLLREISKRYLKSPNVDLPEKMDYLIKHLDSLGVEGAIIVAEQINDLSTYTQFRDMLGAKIDTYFEGSEAVTAVAMGDYLTSFFSSKFDALFESANSNLKSGQDASTKIATAWFHHYFGRSFTGLNIAGKEIQNYDPISGQFLLTGLGRVTFRTIADSIAYLKNLSSLQRAMVVQKSLTDKDGALSTPNNRKKLAKLVNGALGIKNGFVKSVLEGVCTQADAKLLVYPIARMMGPLIFRSLNTDYVDYSQLAGEKGDFHKGDQQWSYQTKLGRIMSENQLRAIAQPHTREITYFGGAYKDYPDTEVAILAGESNDAYFTTTALMEQLFREQTEPISENTENDNLIDPGAEAIIQGIEMSGALGIKGLQLTNQFETLAPNLDRRISEANDSNPGMNKLVFWENLYRLSARDPQIAAFARRIKVGNKIGGGSLQTVFEAQYTTDDGGAEDVVVKMTNPNVENFVQETYLSARKVLEHVSIRARSRTERKYARAGLMALDLAHKWCLEDLNDPNFIEDDDNFRTVVENINDRLGRNTYYVPERRFHSLKVKSEINGKQVTVNRLLKDQNVDFETKQRAVKQLAEFFALQLTGEPVIGRTGENYYLVHSDPQVGNYLFGNKDGRDSIGVIDRSLYLRLERQDIEVFKKLIVGGNDNDFVHSFVDRVLSLDVNVQKMSETGMNRNRIASQTILGIQADYLKQRFITGKVDRISLMRNMLSSFSNIGMEVPLNLRLMIRNIAAFQKLTKEYGLDLSQIYKDIAA